MIIRPYQSEDAPAMAAVYCSAVLTTGSEQYNPRQVEIWAEFARDSDAFSQRVSQGLTLIAQVDDQVAAFGQLDPADHLSLIYTAPEHGRKGLATAIYLQLELAAKQAGSSHISTEASHLSRPFFARQGYQVIETEIVIRHGVDFERFKMRKTLA